MKIFYTKWNIQLDIIPIGMIYYMYTKRYNNFYTNYIKGVLYEEKAILFLSIIMIAVTIMFAGCSESKSREQLVDDAIQGEWIVDYGFGSVVIEFNDGECTHYNYLGNALMGTNHGTYSIGDEYITLTSISNLGDIAQWPYEFEDNILVLYYADSGNVFVRR